MCLIQMPIGMVKVRSITNLTRKEALITYYSKSLSKAQRQNCVTRRELLAIILRVKQFHHYHFLVRTDHGALT